MYVFEYTYFYIYVFYFNQNAKMSYYNMVSDTAIELFYLVSR